MNRRWFAWTVCVVYAGIAVFVAACETSPVHLYEARQFNRERGCLERVPTTIDVLAGDDPGSLCALKCLVPPVGRDAAAERAVFVSAECPPYPPLFDTTGTLPGCPEALAAAERNDICLSDGGTSNPPSEDAGSDAGAVDAGDDDAGFDAGGEDAGPDGATDAASDADADSAAQ